MLNVVRVWLGKSLRIVDLSLPVDFFRLLDYISSGDVDLDEVENLVEKVNEGLRRRGLRIQTRKAVPWDKKADYRLILQHRQKQGHRGQAATEDEG